MLFSMAAVLPFLRILAQKKEIFAWCIFLATKRRVVPTAYLFYFWRTTDFGASNDGLHSALACFFLQFTVDAHIFVGVIFRGLNFRVV